MTNQDDKLRVLLRQWRDVEPAGNFEANVRRRIRLAASGPRRESWLSGLLWRPAFVAVAIAVSVMIGSSAGIFTVSRQQRRAEMQFMSSGTLAGGYARLATEGRR